MAVFFTPVLSAKANIKAGNSHLQTISDLNLNETQITSNNRILRLSEVVIQMDENNTGTFQNIARHVLLYNAVQPECLEHIYNYSWDPPPNSAWFISELQDISWDPTGQYAILLENILQPGIPPYARYIRQYDVQNRLIQNRCDFFFDVVWEIRNRFDYIYVEGLLSSKIDFYFYHFGGSRSFRKTVYNHDLQGRITEENVYACEDSLNWEEDSRNFYYYHANDTTGGDEYNLYLSKLDILPYLFDIHAPGMITEIISQAMMDSVMSNTDRILCTYNTQGKLETVIRQYFADDWLNYRKSIYTYDLNNALSQISHQYWNNDTQNWAAAYELINFTWEDVTSVDDNTLTPVVMNLTAYPNPFNDNLNIRFESKSITPIKTTIYNVRGQVIRTYNNNSKSIVWDGEDEHGKPVSNGIYFINAYQDGKSVSRKVIKIR